MSKYDWQRHGSDPGREPQDGGSDFGPGKDGPAPPGEASGDGPEADAEPRPRTIEQALDLIDRLREQVAAKTVELSEAKDHLLRERAELENFKRRMQREKNESLRYASEHLLRDMLPVLDNLERAVEAASSAEAHSPDAAVQEARVDSLVTGVKMVLHQFRETLARFGVTRIESTGQHFDPSHHEAVAHVETDQQPAGAVVDEHASGYRLHERLLRPAQVTVAKAPRVH
jgi:molecular chaperone GrpE